MEKKIWDTELARKMLAEGCKNPDVAKRVGISVSTLTIWKRKEGLSKSKPMWKRLSDEVYATKEVQNLAFEAKRRGLSYGELVAAREHRVEIAIPKELTARKLLNNFAVERNVACENEKMFAKSRDNSSQSATEPLAARGNGLAEPKEPMLYRNRNELGVAWKQP